MTTNGPDPRTLLADALEDHDDEPTVAELEAEQRRLERRLEKARARAEERERAEKLLSGTAKLPELEGAVRDAGRRLVLARHKLDEATGNVRVAILAALAAGGTEYGLAKMGEVDRATVRTWRGKRKWNDGKSIDPETGG